MASLNDSLSDQVWEDIQTWANEQYQDTGVMYETREETIRAYWAAHGISEDE